MKNFLCVLALLSFSCFAREVPRLSGPVVDEAGLLGSRVELQVDKFLRAYKEKTGNQLQLLTINSLDGEPIENFSIKVVDEWKLGDEKADNGILFLISVQDRKMRIEVGQGLEGVLPDALAGRIIDGVSTYFKRQDYESGIVYGLGQIVQVTGGEVKTMPRSSKKVHLPFWIIYVIFFFFFIMNFFGTRRGFFHSRGGFGGGGFSSGSSGGRGSSWGGGGGGFSGGGSSGGW